MGEGIFGAKFGSNIGFAKSPKPTDLHQKMILVSSVGLNLRFCQNGTKLVQQHFHFVALTL